MMTQDEIRNRALAVLVKVLKTDLETIGDEISQIELSSWDSVCHMNVVLGLENEFDIEFSDSELPLLTSLPLIVAAVKKHTSA